MPQKELAESTIEAIRDALEMDTVKSLLDEYDSRKDVSEEVEVEMLPEETTGEEDTSEPEDAPAASAPLTEVILAKIEAVIEFMKKLVPHMPEVDDSDVKETSVMIWKEADGRSRWMARYSNNFRDRDNPPEIISAASHKRFVELVDKGLAPMPDLMLWHVPEWVIGKATWAGYDDAGFALAAGYFHPSAEPIADALAKATNARCSHGMPESTIVRDDKDRSIIVEHETREISVLPDWSAANEITGFAAFTKEENASKEEHNMIPQEKRMSLMSEFGITEAALAAIETANVADSAKALANGIETKEVEVPQPVTEPAGDSVSQTALSTDEIRSLVAEAVTAALAPLSASMIAISEEIKAVKESSIPAGTPLASITAMLNARSPIGAADTRVDGRTELAKSKPAEAEAAADGGRTMVPFINQIIAQSRK